MDKSALLRLKLSFPNVSGLVLHQWNYQFLETVARLWLQGINTRKLKGLDSSEITSLSEIKKVIYMARHFNHHRQ